MSRHVYVALARVYRSSSSYGSAPFAVPSGSPKLIRVGNEVLEVHLGDVPAWIKRAEARVPIIGGAMLRGMFHGDPILLDQLSAQLSQAGDRILVEEKHKWLVGLILHWQAEWADEDVSQEPWLWFTPAKLLETEQVAKKRAPSLDLAARVLKHDVPNVFDEIIIADRVYVGRDDSFQDACGMPQFKAGGAELTTRSGLKIVEAALGGSNLEAALANSISAPAVPRDPGRPDRLREALRSDLLADDGGIYGRYELLREMQPVLMRASSSHPLSVMFIDMNGLKQINDTVGHRAGDQAIAEFRRAVRETHEGALFRTGGDEFVLFSIAADLDPSALAAKILCAVAARTVEGKALSASVGVALAGDPLEAPDAIIERADREMYRAKTESRRHNPRPCVLATQGAEAVVIRPLP